MKLCARVVGGGRQSWAARARQLPVRRRFRGVPSGGPHRRTAAWRPWRLRHADLRARSAAGTASSSSSPRVTRRRSCRSISTTSTTPDGASLPQLVQSLGYAFATTTYRKNGLAILEGVDDVQLLVAAFAGASSAVRLRTHVTGVSEGGLVATLLAERSPESVLQRAGRVRADRQLPPADQLPRRLPGAVRLLLPGGAARIGGGRCRRPLGLDVAARRDPTSPRSPNALLANPAKALELMRVSRVAYDPAELRHRDPVGAAILRYTVLGLNDAMQLALGGNRFGNRGRWYFGSSNDLRLNLLVRRSRRGAGGAGRIGAVRDQRRPEHPAGHDPHHRRRGGAVRPRAAVPAQGRPGRPRARSCRFRWPATATATSPPTEVGLSLLFAANLP